METNSPNIGKFSLTYGSIAGIVGIIFSFMLISLDMLYDQGSEKTAVSIAILVGAVILGIFNFRKENGSLTLKQALKIGTGSSVIAAIYSIVFTIVLVNFIEPDFIAKTLSDQVRATLIERNPTISNEELDMNTDQLANFFWLAYPPFMLIYYAFRGLIIGLLGGLILKKDAQA
jgi:putative flippase GtrA